METLDIKLCSKCRTIKALDLFAIAKGRADGRQSWCRACRADHYAKPEVGQKVRDRVRERKFGLSKEEFDQRFKDQNGVCAICKTESPRTKHAGKLCVDHDHVTGNVRGLLCNNCNPGLGHFKDDPGLLQAAIEYLRSR